MRSEPATASSTRTSTRHTGSAPAREGSTCSPSDRGSTSRAASFPAAVRCGRSPAGSRCTTAIPGTASPSSSGRNPNGSGRRRSSRLRTSKGRYARAATTELAAVAGSRWTGLKHIELEPGTLSGPPHCHSAEEELFVVLDGEGTLELFEDELQRHPVRCGSVVARPPATGIAHAFRAGDGGLTLIAWGTREPNDICWYPRSNKIYWRGVDVVARIEQLDYWEGEELE